MNSSDILSIHPSELRFPFELKKQSSSSIQLSNTSDQYIAFKVKTTNPKKYCVRPNAGVVLPGSTSNVTVTMQAPKEAPPDMQCRDKFLIQYAFAPPGATNKNITADMFTKEGGKEIHEFKIRVAYFPANPPSPVPEGSEEGSPPRESLVEHSNQNPSLADAVTRSFEGTKEQSSSLEEWFMISKLTDEKACVMQQNQLLRQELELLRREVRKGHSDGFSMLLVMLVGLLGVLIGFFLKRT